MTETKPKIHQTSSPREFFERLYGNLEDNKKNQVSEDGDQSRCQVGSQSGDIVAPVPILAAPLSFLLPSGTEAQLTAAAAGLSAFCKSNFYIFKFLYIQGGILL